MHIPPLQYVFPVSGGCLPPLPPPSFVISVLVPLSLSVYNLHLSLILPKGALKIIGSLFLNLNIFNL